MEEVIDFLAELRNKAKRQGANLEVFLHEIDPSGTGEIPMDSFRKLLANLNVYADEDKFEFITSQYTDGKIFYYELFIHDVDSTKPNQNTSVNPEDLKWFYGTLRERGIDLADFLRTYDRNRSGLISQQVFLRNFGNSPVVIEIAKAYSNYQNNVNYVKLSDDLKSSRNVVSSRKTDFETPAAINGVASAVRIQNINFSSLFSRADRYRKGLVSVQQFEQILSSAIPNLSPTQVSEISSSYTSGNMIDYVHFVDAISKVEVNHPISKVSAVDIQSVLNRLKGEIQRRHSNIQSQVEDLDRQNSGKIPFWNFFRLLKNSGFQISDAEGSSIESTFSDPSGGLFDYVTFFEALKGPQQQLPKYQDIIADIQDNLQAIQLQLEPSFRKYDNRSSNYITFSQFLSGLREAGIQLKDDEIQVLRSNLAPTASSLVDYPSFCNSVDPIIQKSVKSPLPELPKFDKKEIASVSLQVMTKVAAVVIRRGIDILKEFSKNDSRVKGSISIETFKSILRTLPIELSPHELDLTCEFYLQPSTNEVNYMQFYEDMEEFGVKRAQTVEIPPEPVHVEVPADEEVEVTHPAPRDPATLQLCSTFREKLMARHKRVNMPFIGIKRPEISANEFRRCIETYGLVVRETDVQRLIRSYSTNAGVEWAVFCSDVENSR